MAERDTRVVYHWNTGEQVSTVYRFFEREYKELCTRLGPPVMAACSSTE